MSPALIAYGSAAVLPLIIAICRMRLWRCSLSVPFRYDSDAMTHCMLIKGMLDNGWYTQNSYIGMPTEWSLYDYPSLQTLHYLIMKGMSVFLRDYALLMNVYYLLGFSMIAVFAVFVLRQFQLSYPSAVVGGVLYSLLPYRFFRGVAHLGLTAYFTVPLAMMLGLWLQEDEETWPHLGRLGLYFRLSRSRVIISILACCLIGLSGIYYVFFSIYIISVSGLSTALERKSTTRLIPAVGFVAIILSVCALNHSPVLRYRYVHGSNPSVTTQNPGEALRLGLELSSMLIPRANSGIKPIDQISRDNIYAHRHGRLSAGNYIGIVGVVGVFILFLEGLKIGSSRQSDMRLRRLSIMNISLILLSSIGGLGYLFALLVTPKIRDYGRVSVFIAFAAIAAFFIVADLAAKRLSGRKLGRVLLLAILGGILSIGSIDQTKEPYLNGVSGVLEHDRTKRQYEIDGNFIGMIENKLPENSMIFQLPYISWPGGGQRHEMATYDHFKGYLHSRSLRWSFGAVKDRPGDMWLRRTASKDIAEMVESLSLMGFAGVYIDRYGYQDSGESIVSRLREFLVQEPLESEDRRRVFFRISEYSSMMQDRYGPDEWEERRAEEHLVLSLRRGFHGPKEMRGAGSRWCSSYGELWIHNIASRPIECILSMDVRTPQSDSSQLTIESTLFTHVMTLSKRIKGLERAIVVPPGDYVVVFRCDAPNAAKSRNSRFLSFMATNPSLERTRWHRDDENQRHIL